jgi:hypothetical protein
VPVNGHPVDVVPYRHVHRQAVLNSPDQFLMRIPAGESVPKFFLAAGAADPGDVTAAEAFRQELMLRNSAVPLLIVSGGGHQATVWRAALTPLFDWMTPQLAREAEKVGRGAAHVT